jgi:hypothetical protein
VILGIKSGTLGRTAAAGADGLDFINVDVQVTARAALAINEIGQFNLTQSDGDVSTVAQALASTIAPTAAGVAGAGMFGVALAAIDIDTVGTVRVQGRVTCLAVNDAGIGTRAVIVAATGTLDGTSAAGERFHAITLAAFSGSTVDCIFDGINGFGVDHA